MQETITFNDLILFAFNETEMKDTVKVTRTLESNTKANECYQNILSTIHGLENMQLSPSEATCNKILSAAR